MLAGYTRKTRPSDIPYIAENLRAADLAEVKASSKFTPLEVLLYSFLAGKPCMTICKGDETPVAMWGVTPESDTVGRVWMLGTDELTKDKSLRLRFLREAKLHLNEILKSYAVLWNYVDARNTVHLRWIRWMGFTFVAKHPHYGEEQRPFFEFCKASSCVIL